MCELFFKLWKQEKEKSTQSQTCSLFFVFPQKGTSLDEGSFMVDHWLWEEQQLHLLERVHILLCKGPLMARGSFRMSVCTGRGSGNRRRNNGRKGSGYIVLVIRIIVV